jgi:hypothetical protein
MTEGSLPIMSEIRVVRATPDRLSVLAGVLGRAFADDPMIQWPLEGRGTPDTMITPESSTGRT